MNNIQRIAEKLVKIYPLEVTRYAPKFYRKVDGFGHEIWDMLQITALVDQHLRTLGVPLDIELNEIALEVGEDMFNNYYL